MIIKKNIDKLSESLKYNNTLKILDLSYNYIEIFNKLYKCLKYNNILTKLNLGYNKIINIDIL